MGKRLLLVAIGVFVSALGFAQRPGNHTRGPVILVDQPGPDIKTSDPTGHYTQTHVVGKITHGYDPDSYNLGDWTFDVRLGNCSDCDPGQYDLFIDYKGITYLTDQNTHIQETGVGGGFLNPSTGVISFYLIPLNCDAINRSGEKYNNTHGFGLTGNYQGGGDSEEPGARIEIVGDVIRGRVSGRDCIDAITSPSGEPTHDCIVWSDRRAP
jgi:hypothetical protein